MIFIGEAPRRYRWGACAPHAFVSRFLSALAPSARILEDVQYPMPQEIAPPPAHSAQLDRSALEAALRRHLRGEVRFDSGSRALYATDGSNYRQVPIGVVVPRDKEDVLAAVSLCRDHRAPLLARGGGTSLAGQCCNAAVILDFSKYMAGILEIPRDASRASSPASFSTIFARPPKNTISPSRPIPLPTTAAHLEA